MTAALLAALAACSGDDAAQPDADLPDPDAPDARLTDARLADAETAPDARTVTPALVVAGGPLALVEGQAGTFTVALDAAPAGAITVDVASALPAVFRAAPATLRFDAASWATPQAVTVTALEDDDTAGATGVVTARAAGLADAAVTIQVVDNDAPLAINAAGNLLLREGGSTFFVVTLNRAPAQAVQVAVRSESPAILTVSPATLTFTASTWHVPQRVTVTSAIDADLVDGSSAVWLSSPGLAPVAVAATIVDDTLPRIAASPAALQLDEGDAGTVRISLRDRPARDTVVTLVASEPAAVTMWPREITFKPTDFDREVVVVLATAVDADGDDEQVAIDLAIAGEVQTSIPVAIRDHIVRAIRATPSPFAAAEGVRRELDVVLTAAPPGDLVVHARSEDATIAAVTPAVAFTRANWNVPQRLVVVGVDDADVADEATAVVLEADGYQSARVEVSVVEGSTREVVVALRRPPGRTVVVTAAIAAAGVATVAPAELTFTDATWNVPQHLVLAGVRDGNTVDDRTELRLRSDGAADLVREVEVVDTRVP